MTMYNINSKGNSHFVNQMAYRSHMSQEMMTKLKHKSVWNELLAISGA